MVGGLDLGGGGVVGFAVEVLVVLSPHPFQCRELELLDFPPGFAMAGQFGLVATVDGLGESVVVGVADAAGRWLRAEFENLVGVDHGHVV